MARQKLETTYVVLLVLNIVLLGLSFIVLSSMPMGTGGDLQAVQRAAGLAMVQKIEIIFLVISAIALFARYTRFPISRPLFLASNVLLFLNIPLGTVAGFIGLVKLSKAQEPGSAP